MNQLSTEEQEDLLMNIQKLEEDTLMKKTLLHFTEIMGLYQTIKGEPNTQEHA